MKVALFSWNNRFPAANGAAFRSLEAARSLVRIADLHVVVMRQEADDGLAFPPEIGARSVVELGRVGPIDRYTLQSLRRRRLPHILMTEEVVNREWETVRSVADEVDVLVLDRPYWLDTGIANLPTPTIHLQADAEHIYYREYATQTKAKRRLQAIVLQQMANRIMMDLYKRSDHIVSISEADRRETSAHTSVPISVVPTSVELGDWQLSERSDDGFLPRVTFLGTDEPRNVWALHHYCDVILPALDDRHRNIHVVGRFSPEIQQEFRHHPISFTGWVDDIVDHLHVGDIMIAPYQSNNGLKAKVLHSLAMGLPVVATSPVADSLLSTDGTVIADTPAEFRSALLALSDEETYRKHRELALQNVRRNYSVEATTKRWNTVLESVSRGS